MAETVYKKIAELDSASQPLAGTELLETSQLGASKKVALTNLYGTGWFAKLIAAFSAFKAPDSDHADNADTLGVGEEEPSDFHDAAQLTGAIHLDRIPAELTGKNAATVGGYAVGTTGNTIRSIHGYLGSSGVGTFTENQIFDAISPAIPNVGDWIFISGSYEGGNWGTDVAICSRASRSSSNGIDIYAKTSSVLTNVDVIGDGVSDTRTKVSLAW